MIVSTLESSFTDEPGDYFAMGEHPSPTEQLDRLAAQQGKKCDIYHLLSFAMDMYCIDESDGTKIDNLADRGNAPVHAR